MFIKILWFIETIVFLLLGYLIPKDPDLLIFWCRRGESIVWNPKIFYLYLNERYTSKYNLLFYDKNSINNNKDIKTYSNNLRKYRVMLRAKYIFIDNCSFDVWLNGVFLWNFNVIQTWHWEPIKWIGFLSELYLKRRNKIVLFFEKLEYRNYKYILSNPATVDVISWVFANKHNVIWIWLPRNDILLHKDILNLVKNEKVEKHLNKLKESYSKIILLAPTFREVDNYEYFSEEEISKLNDILLMKNYYLIIKTHPDEKRNFLFENQSNITNITKILHYDAIDFLPFVDILMTDYSSIYIDFLLTWKPIIYYQKDLKHYIDKERGLLYNPREVVIKELTAYSFNDLVNIFYSLDSIVWSHWYAESYTNLYSLFFNWLDITTPTCEKLSLLLNK